MITLDECLIADKDKSKRSYPCYHCGKSLNKTNAMALSFVTVDDGVTHKYTGERNDGEQRVLTIIFCLECFEECAGKKYMFEEMK